MVFTLLRNRFSLVAFSPISAVLLSLKNNHFDHFYDGVIILLTVKMSMKTGHPGQVMMVMLMNMLMKTITTAR